MTITLNLSPELERRLRATSAAKGVPAESIVVAVLSENLAGPAAPANEVRLTSEESRLLIAINQGLTEPEWHRYRALIARRDAGTITELERDELIYLCDRLELLHAERLEKLAELARLRGVTLDQVMDQLGIRRPAHE